MSLGRASHFGNLVNLFDVSTSRFREEHQIIVGSGGEQMLDEVALLFLSRAFARGHADDSFSATTLGAKCADRGAFNEAAMGNADNAAFVRDEVFHVDLSLIGCDLG